MIKWCHEFIIWNSWEEIYLIPYLVYFEMYQEFYISLILNNNLFQSEEKENSLQVTSSPVSVENIQSFNSQFINSTKENITPLSYNWWSNPNYLGNIMYPMRNRFMEENSHLDGGNVHQERSDNSQASDSPAMYRNIVFVPVPAYYTMPSGYYSSNMNLPFIFPKKEETMNNNVSREDESF